MSKGVKLFVSLLLPLAVATISGLFTAQEVTGWYVGLNKPSWNPPNWLFGPVWSVLYILMGKHYTWCGQVTLMNKRSSVHAGYLLRSWC